MASEDRTQAQHLSFLSAAAEEVKKYGLFALARGAEARALDLPLIGRARRPSQNIVDLAQDPNLGFAETTLTSVKISGGRARLRGLWLGLTGPMGPLPTHLTEFAYYERRYSTKQPFGDWLDVIAGRMLQLFYRAWADSQPAATADRPNDDRFSAYLSAVSGAMEGATDSSAFSRQARVHYAGLFAGPRSAVAIEDAMSHLLGQPVTLLEYQPRWRRFEPDDFSRLGRAYATLGGNLVLGEKIKSASDAFRVVIRAKNFRDYRALLPTGDRFAVAAEALDAFKPAHIEWDICLQIDDAQAPPARLDGLAALGWTSWVKPPGSRRKSGSRVVRSDAHLRRLRRFNQGMKQ